MWLIGLALLLLASSSLLFPLPSITCSSFPPLPAPYCSSGTQSMLLPQDFCTPCPLSLNSLLLDILSHKFSSNITSSDRPPSPNHPI